jgi:hypothetical protein
VFIPCRNKRRLTEIIHIGKEHTKAGIFVMEAPTEVLNRAKNGDSDALAMVEDTIQSMAQISVGERACIVMPSSVGHDGKPSGWSFDLKNTASSSRGDAIEMIRMHREDIAIGIGITFLLLGMNGSGGSKGQSEDQTSLAATIMQGLGDRVSDVFTRQLFPRIVAMNGMDPALCPTMTYTHPRKVDLTGSHSMRISSAWVRMMPYGMSSMTSRARASTFNMRSARRRSVLQVPPMRQVKTN